ncbi:rod shape-determining protein MreD [Pseudoruegeria sp. HB172150]|uniref:rod shape-determining protein MreD n=1 Tax=Pseudoruegeria sp. HB172150 TaxID=2721164 RepID=UPI001551CE69|nr:rod shape-determining protein MreD [Pseudoruegeria sp. HB172150]
MDRGRLTANQWLYGIAYLSLSLAIILMHILPTDLGPRGYPGPDLLLCITCAWVLRRPHYVPTLLIAAVFLLTDILYMRPPGLWTGLVVLSVEYLRAREGALREQPLMVEIGVVAAVMAFINLSNFLVLLILGVPQAQFGLMLLQLIATVITYPIIVIVARVLFRVQKMSSAEFDAVRRAQ